MKIKITNGMYMALIINMVYAKSIGVTQGSIARDVGSDMWISTIIATVSAMLLILLTVMIIRRMPKADIFDQSKAMLGPWVGKLICLVIFIFFTLSFGPIMVTFVFHLKDFFLPEAPLFLFVFIAVLVGGFAIYFGIEVIARMALIGVFSILLLNGLLILGALEDFDVRELLPVFEFGITKPVIASRHHLADWSIVIMMCLIILPLVDNQKEWGRSSLVGVIFSFIFIVMWPILETGVLTSQVTSQYLIACMQMARSAHLGFFLHRYEMFMIAFFGISILTQIAIALLCGSVALSKLFGLKDFRPLIIPVSLIMGGYGYWVVQSHNHAMDILENSWVSLSLSITLGVVGVVWILGFFLKKKFKSEKG
ncbi:GerAB/ArcD/ProY family transporter [Aquibacillus sediminis]|uniref:GerAB/ArcD/ProY family transporter n=1 Tax=Aquibacillus sediminis TaxID=2574734 RepID=UPI001108ED50|nr:GerAB/ArcD/ProY family transporter [Aquibacillus sediminis]